MGERYRMVLKDDKLKSSKIKDLRYKYLSEEAKKIKKDIENNLKTSKPTNNPSTTKSSNSGNRYSKIWSERLTELFNNIYEAIAKKDDSEIKTSLDNLNNQISLYWSLLKDVQEGRQTLKNILYKANSKLNKVKRYLNSKEVSK